ncbi:bifunctional 4-hydroxy-2-oxoglutarate aldolase/2-dehydro-3-deoxy-phosphogluconate aldolase [Streptomyces sp. 7-21]|uniref:bifunctional 4-hydroxy-2-oxoglutarate aldolase/2-dehydro-3-deoxy-phosphogluconate aldolase n=1 Tax=Streptomyces sp. 7-21 TaxID=2802283 RepID=UPI0019200DF5|nr:bifunctional 4-hydroxy-2-oxoglutarate aldolase/2-dehydro-3-deoxy-phosphogluconate aldolase [Streptomyces sp. 7-21]MBL1067914.1 bifunctional 4-hydroxy-2-oxoglutarate aldolase/2-dehydro-3-deoxy-phosphogluconate aldolase [Streptomyces sp. 7-21]
MRSHGNEAPPHGTRAAATDRLLAALAAQRLLPVLRSPDAAAATAAVGGLLDAGCQVVELTTSTPDWQRALAACRERHGAAAGQPGPLLGVGTVTTAEQATAAIGAGADFLVSPYPAPAVREAAAGHGIPFIEGGFTPAEIADAAGRGPAKVFPAHVGGPKFLSSLRAVLPHAALIPTGGISVDEAGAYLEAGAVAVGVGSGLPQDPAQLARLFGGGR